MKPQTGFVLVSVLMITTITTMLAFSQMSENRLQEGIAGNQQKELNARLAAEKGLFVAFEYIDANNKAGASNTQILAGLNALPAHADYSLPLIELDALTFTFTLLSKGEVHGATAYLKTQIVASEEVSSSLFKDAVAGCAGVAIGSGGGTVDSYNSRAGDYGAVLDDGSINKSENGTVATIESGADIELSGTGKVFGNIISNGDISTGNSSATEITGSITAAGNIQLKDISTSGDIYAGGDLDFKQLTLTDENSEITVVGNIDGTQLSGTTEQVTYGDSNNSNYDFGDPTSGIVDPDTDLGECDPVRTTTSVGIAAVMASLTAEITAGSLPAVSSADMTEAAYTFTDNSVSSGGVVGGTSSTIAALGAVSGMGALDENTKVIILDGSLELSSKTIEIDGNVTLLIKGNIDIKQTTFSFANADTSSLTIITDGKIDIDTLTNMFSGESVNSEGNPPLTVYSSYESSADDDYALNLTSNANMYTKLYAPLGNLALGGGAEIMGAVRGKNVTVSAGTAIHYDEVLSTLSDDVETEAIPASYSSVYYHYPDT
jgi:hypothetical protein